MARHGADRRAVASAIALSALVHLPSLLSARPLDDDEVYLASMGRMLRAGDALYVDVIDRKPPIVMWIYELLVPASWNLQLVRAVMVLFVALNGLVVAAIAREFRASHTGARTAGALAIIATALAGFSDAHSANFELWGLLPASVAVLVALRASRSATARSQLVGFVSAGALVGVATNCKQPYVFTVFVVAAAATAGRRRAAAIGALTGLAAVTATIAGVAGWSGYWRWTWFENGDYIKVGVVTLLGVGVRQLVVFGLLQWPLFAAWRLGDREAVDLHARLVLGVWTLASLAGVASGLRFFGHYFHQVVPPLAVIAGMALADRPARARLVRMAALAFAFALLPLGFVAGFRGLDAAPPRVAAAITERTTTNDRVLVWGRLPDVAARARRTPAGKFVHQAYLTGDWAAVTGARDPARTEPYAARWESYLDGLAADPPRLIVDASSLVADWRDRPMRVLPLQHLVDRCYRVASRVAGLPTYEWSGSACTVHDNH